jgi:PAS domain S-box-containing protein
MSSHSPERDPHDPGLAATVGPGNDLGAEPALDIPSRAGDPPGDAWTDGDTRAPEDGDLPTRRSSPLELATATFVLYAITGLASLVVAIAPAYASPLYPSAGIALAAVLVHRMPALVGVFFGAFAVNLSLGQVRGTEGLESFVIGVAIAGGASLQALVGAWAVRRLVRQPLTLTDPGDIARFFAAGAAVCVVSAGVATLVLQAAGVVQGEALALTFAQWWAGDAIGVMIGAPILLTLIGRPRGDWAHRRLTVGLAMTVATVVMTAAIVQAESWNQSRDREAFRLAVQTAVRGVQSQLDEFERSVELAVTLSRSGVGLADGGLARLVAPPLPSDAGSLRWHAGDTLAAQVAAEAPHEVGGLRQALATSAIEQRLVPYGDGVPGRGLRLVRAVTAPMPGVLAVEAHPHALLSPVTADLPSGYRLCLLGVPASESAAPRLLAHSDADTIACEQVERPDSDRELTPLQLGQLSLNLLVMAPAPSGQRFRDAQAWLLSMIGLLATAMFGALMLTVSGRTRRIQVAVKARTAQLEAQIRERERTERALRDSEQRFRNILNTVPIAIVYSDLDGRVRQANPKFCDLLGYDSADLLSMRTQDFTDPQDQPIEADFLDKLVRGQLPGYRLRKRYVARGGRRIWVQSVVTALRDDRGEPRRIVGVAEDISEQLRLAESERARESAEAANRAKSDFLSRMSHELRTPLNAMLGFAQLLEMDARQPLTAAQRPWVTQIQQAGWHLLDMINDVLDLSRIEAGTLRLQPQPIDVGEQLDACVVLVEQKAARRGVSIHQSLDADGARMMGDATRVKQILTNLLSNAVKYNVDGGQVHITVRRVGDTVEVAVRDTGLGMSPAQIEQLFQPFNRLGRERTGTEGTGIGLVISRRLAELMGGSLMVQSSAGQGSVFQLRLPRADTAPADRRDTSGLGNLASDYHQRHVHYIEDNETNIEVMRGILAQRPQVRLEVSTTGTAGLAALKANRPDLLLLDMHLPDTDGLQLLQVLRDDPQLAHIPVVVVSADAMGSQIEAALAAGALAYLTKPVSVSELLRVVDERLDAVDTAFG